IHSFCFTSSHSCSNDIHIPKSCAWLRNIFHHFDQYVNDHSAINLRALLSLIFSTHDYSCKIL
ncbi:hypothetical protein L1Z39_15215, partial [Acinetobacter baumannii]|nr:hypothetical protein [Acinetobacter baumannii]